MYWLRLQLIGWRCWPCIFISVWCGILVQVWLDGMLQWLHVQDAFNLFLDFELVFIIQEVFFRELLELAHGNNDAA